ncbi:type II secretion system protein J [Haloimpatiens sp. FM7330]|uniref:PulJ/GspJ family protein n=1 Tax=Haloimpatiens sp. FM7330 TaxID=3298610 RepID=UPI003624C145
MNMKMKKLNKKGFTLAELLISLGIMSFIIMTAYSFMNSSSRLIQRQINASNTQNDIRFAVEWITKDLENAENFNIGKEQDISYIIGDIKYYKVQQGEIGENKVYKIIRESPIEGKIILIENVSQSEDAFKITKNENIFNVNIIIKDKLNNDKSTNFKVSSRKDISFNIKPKPDVDVDSNKPFIDINNNGVLDENDYNIEFDRNGTYDSDNDVKYTKGTLVFPANFNVEEDKTIICIVKDGIRVKEGVKVTTSNNGKIVLDSRSIIASGAELNSSGSGNKKGEIVLKSKDTINLTRTKLKIDGKGSKNAKGNITVTANGSIQASYIDITTNSSGSGKGNIDISSRGSIMLSYSNVNSSSNGKGNSSVSISSSGSINCVFSKLTASKNGKSYSSIEIEASGAIDSRFVQKNGNGYITIR